MVSPSFCSLNGKVDSLYVFDHKIQQECGSISQQNLTGHATYISLKTLIGKVDDSKF